MRSSLPFWLCVVVLVFTCAVANAQSYQGGGSFAPQCPTSTVWHPASGLGYDPASTENPAGYTGPKLVHETVSGVPLTYTAHDGAIKCQQVSGGDGYMTEADGNQTFMFSFGPLSGLNAIANGQAGTQFAATFNKPYCDPALPNYTNGQPNPNYGSSGCNSGTDPNGAVGYVSPTAGDPRPGADAAAIMNTGVMNGNIPAPLIAFDEDDELFLTLTNVGMIMRPDLFEQHTIHFHGYPNASSFYDGVPDASLAINIGGSFTYYYLAPDAGTYFWHCHITPPEHLQMGMVGQLFVRPRQNRVPVGHDVYSAVTAMQSDLRTACQGTGGGSSTPPSIGYTYGANGNIDILCSAPLPIGDVGAIQTAGAKYAYNDGDGSTQYDIDVPIQIHGFDPNFHFVGMTFNPEGFADMKDKYFLLNGRSYPDTVGVPGYVGLVPATSTDAAGNAVVNPDPVTHAISTESSDGFSRPSQPLPTLITLSSSGAGGAPRRALLRIADLDVTEYQTLQSLGIPMTIVGFNAKLLRDQAGNNLFIKTNSITLGGGESLDAILDATGVTPGTYFLYTPNLDHLSNDAENFGGLMTEVVVTN
jgi:Multicopper oxidase